MSRKLGYEVDVIGNLVPGDLTAYVLDDLVRRPPWPMLSHKLFENVNSLFANESDGYKTTSAPSAFRFSCGRRARTGQESTPEQSECHLSKPSSRRFISPMSRPSSRKSSFSASKPSPRNLIRSRSSDRL